VAAGVGVATIGVDVGRAVAVGIGVWVGVGVSVGLVVAIAGTGVAGVDVTVGALVGIAVGAAVLPPQAARTNIRVASRVWLLIFRTMHSPIRSLKVFGSDISAKGVRQDLGNPLARASARPCLHLARF
jgi:hypothetical protein